MKNLNRRQVLAAGGCLFVPRHVLGGAGVKPPSEKLNIAFAGIGNKGYENVMNLNAHGENLAFFCDVDDRGDNARDQKWDHIPADIYKKFPKVKRYRDYRKMLEKEEKNIDAVVVTTTDHLHAFVSMAAMRMGKHVYCEKPLAHSIFEARKMAEFVKGKKIATQMGNSAHSGPAYTRAAKLIKSGLIGEVAEVHCWCDKAWGGQKRPQNSPPVPDYLDWDLWIGPAPMRPYHPCYHPKSWRSWCDFGNGRIGDMGCHMMDMPFTALDLTAPLTIETRGAPRVTEAYTNWMIVDYTFPKRGDLPPVKLTWYDGGKRPELNLDSGVPGIKEAAVYAAKKGRPWCEASLFIGTKGVLIATYGMVKVFPEKQFDRASRIKVDFPKTHYHDWTDACRNGSKAGTNFGYSGNLTETILLGTVAWRAGEKIEWDCAKMKVTNSQKANDFIQREYRKGWEL